MARHRPAAVGIDFGTSTSLVARRRTAESMEIFSIGVARRWLPSLVGLRDGRYIVGEEAETAEHVIRSIKRAITEDRPTVASGDGDDAVEVRRDEIIIEIFRELDKRSKDNGLQLNRHRDLRLGCPAMWRRDQRQLLISLVEAAGIRVDAMTLVEEPVAAGLAWISSGQVPAASIGGRLLVFDMGGGTLDIAVLDVEAGDPPGVRVLTSVGLPSAGDTLDEAIALDLRTQLAEHGIQIHRLKRPSDARAEVLRQARTVKVLLSAAETQPILFARALFGGQRVPAVRYSRDRLEEISGR
jgi:molecular chaperone DnaK (HSP70)